MAVYVDDMAMPFRQMTMHHMIADTDDELHAMAERIGVQRKWWQAPPAHDSHYDISKGKKALALKAGAIEITWREASLMTIRRRHEGPGAPLVTPDEGEAYLAGGIKARRHRRDDFFFRLILGV